MMLDRQKSWQALRIIVAWQIYGPDKGCLDDWLTVPPQPFREILEGSLRIEF